MLTYKATFESDGRDDARLAWRTICEVSRDGAKLGLFAGLLADEEVIGWIVERFSPWALIPIAVAVAVGVGALAVRSSPSTRQRVRSGLGTGPLLTLALTNGEYMDAAARFAKVTPTIPEWEELAATNDPEMVRVRACLHALGGARAGSLSARKLARGLRPLGIGEGEQLVRLPSARTDASTSRTSATGRSGNRPGSALPSSMSRPPSGSRSSGSPAGCRGPVQFPAPDPGVDGLALTRRPRPSTWPP